MPEPLKQSTTRTRPTSGATGSGKKRGAAMLVALALTLCLTMLIVAIQLQITTELKSSKGQRDYDRALQLAEAGANAYLNYLATSPSGSPSLMPWNIAAPPTISSGVPSTAQIRSDILAGNIKVGNGSNTVNGTAYASTMGLVSYPAQATLTTKPAAGAQYGYFVVLQTLSSATVSLISYGYANGVVRRIQVTGGSSDVFDWAAVYGMDPYTSGATGPGLAANGNPTGTDSGPAWSFSNNTSIVGASGAEGLISISAGSSAYFYDGPVILAGNGNTYNTTDPSPLQSSPGTPGGHVGTGILANPFVRRRVRNLDIETADQAAVKWAASAFGDSSATGVDYYRTNHNNNATGIKYFVKATSGPHLGQYRELSGPNIVTTNGGVYTLDVSQPSASTLKNSYGMDSTNETYWGLRIYPGNYYITYWKQTQSDRVYIRSFADGQGPGLDENGNTFNIYSSGWSTLNPANPNSGMSAEKNIRVWIGDDNKNQSKFSNNTTMENSTYASRFRIYVANRAGVSVSGTQTRQFRVNLLVKNAIAGTGGNVGKTVYYGSVGISSGTYLLGSLLGWQVTTSGSATVEKQAAEGSTSGGGMGSSNSDRVAYQVTAWKELP